MLEGTVFWDVTVCNLVEVYVPPKRQVTSARLHSVTSQKAVVFLDLSIVLID
jgi:hypothetical protein